MIKKFYVEEIPEGEFKGLMCVKVICTKDFSKLLLDYFQKAIIVSQSVSNLMGAVGMK